MSTKKSEVCPNTYLEPAAVGLLNQLQLDLSKEVQTHSQAIQWLYYNSKQNPYNNIALMTRSENCLNGFNQLVMFIIVAVISCLIFNYSLMVRTSFVKDSPLEYVPHNRELDSNNSSNIHHLYHDHKSTNLHLAGSVKDLSQLSNEPRYYWAGNGHSVVAEVADSKHWIRTLAQSRANWIWARSYVYLDQNLNHNQMINHVYESEMIWDKANLAVQLRNFDYKMRHSPSPHLHSSSFLPQTFLLQHPEDCKRLLNTAEYQNGVVWVRKEPNNSQGEGMTIMTNLTALHQELWDESKQACRTVDRNGEEIIDIVQRYITDLFLLNGAKMEIRTYWLIASVDPLLVLYRDGTVRRTTKEFKLGDWDDPLIHITNVLQQKKANPEYDQEAMSQILKSTLYGLSEYMISKGVTDNQNYIEDVLKPKLKTILVHIVNTTYQEWQKVDQTGRFELLGMDTMLDRDLNPWVTEIQLGPGLSTDDPIKAAEIPDMLSEIMDIVLEVNYRKTQGLDLKSLSSVRRFEWLINQESNFWFADQDWFWSVRN